MLRLDSTLGWKGGLDVFYDLESRNGLLEEATRDMICRMIVLHTEERLNVELDMLSEVEF